MESINAFFSYIYSIFSEPDIDEETEELRMITNLEVKEILRLREYFQSLSANSGFLAADDFLSMDSIKNNPLKERIAYCFGYNENVKMLDFKSFIVGFSLFNSVSREELARTAFMLHDFDNDGFISKEDLRKYVVAITSKDIADDDIDEIVDNVFNELHNPKLISFAEFQHIITFSDFHAKLRIPF